MADIETLKKLGHGIKKGADLLVKAATSETTKKALRYAGNKIKEGAEAVAESKTVSNLKNKIKNFTVAGLTTLSSLGANATPAAAAKPLENDTPQTIEAAAPENKNEQPNETTLYLDPAQMQEENSMAEPAPQEAENQTILEAETVSEEMPSTDAYAAESAEQTAESPAPEMTSEEIQTLQDSINQDQGEIDRRSDVEKLMEKDRFKNANLEEAFDDPVKDRSNITEKAKRAVKHGVKVKKQSATAEDVLVGKMGYRAMDETVVHVNTSTQDIRKDLAAEAKKEAKDFGYKGSEKRDYIKEQSSTLNFHDGLLTIDLNMYDKEFSNKHNQQGIIAHETHHVLNASRGIYDLSSDGTWLGCEAFAKIDKADEVGSRLAEINNLRETYIKAGGGEKGKKALEGYKTVNRDMYKSYISAIENGSIDPLSNKEEDVAKDMSLMQQLANEDLATMEGHYSNQYQTIALWHANDYNIDNIRTDDAEVKKRCDNAMTIKMTIDGKQQDITFSQSITLDEQAQKNMATIDRNPDLVKECLTKGSSEFSNQTAIMKTNLQTKKDTISKTASANTQIAAAQNNGAEK